MTIVVDNGTSNHSNDDNANNGDADDHTDVSFLSASDINSALDGLKAGYAIADLDVRYLGETTRGEISMEKGLGQTGGHSHSKITPRHHPNFS